MTNTDGDPISDSHNCLDADIVLRSTGVKASDQPQCDLDKATLFRVHSYRLKAFSPVFRDMLQLGEGHATSHEKAIQLEESTGTLSWLLDLMHDDIAQPPLLGL